MTAVLLACGLGLAASWPIAAFGWLCGRWADRLTTDPRWRERVWTTALVLPVGVLLAAAAVAALPDLGSSSSAPPGGDPAAVGPVRVPAAARQGAVDALLGEHAVGAAAVAAFASALGLLLSIVRLQRGRAHLAGLVGGSTPLNRPAFQRALEDVAERLGAAAPPVLVTSRVDRPLLVGLRRPVILLPETLASIAEDRLLLICAHETAHAARGDNLRLAWEELLLGAFWFTPPLRAIRSRLTAVREEACDALTLAGASPAARRGYADTLVHALRLSAGLETQTAFTGAGRKGHAMRLQAILNPPEAPRQGAAAALTAVIGALAATALLGSAALAQQAELASARAAPVPKARADVARAAPSTLRAPVVSPQVQVGSRAEPTGATNRPASRPSAPGAQRRAASPLAAVLSPPPAERSMNPDPAQGAAAKPAPAEAKVGMTISAESLQYDGEGRAVWTGKPEVRVERLGATTFAINGAAAPASFDPKSLSPEAVDRVEVLTSKSGAPAVVNFLLKPDQPR